MSEIKYNKVTLRDWNTCALKSLYAWQTNFRVALIVVSTFRKKETSKLLVNYIQPRNQCSYQVTAKSQWTDYVPTESTNHNTKSSSHSAATESQLIHQITTKSLSHKELTKLKQSQSHIKFATAKMCIDIFYLLLNFHDNIWCFKLALFCRYLLGMHAFGLEETLLYDQAEKTARRVNCNARKKPKLSWKIEMF